jgi:hypothetical protein
LFSRALALTTAENHLIELLPAKDRRRLLGIAEHVQLAQSDVLGEAGKPTRFIYFPVNGFISLVTSIEGKPVLEVGMVGREGLLGAQVALRVLTQPLHALGAYRIGDCAQAGNETRSMPEVSGARIEGAETGLFIQDARYSSPKFKTVWSLCSYIAKTTEPLILAGLSGLSSPPQ